MIGGASRKITKLHATRIAFFIVLPSSSNKANVLNAQLTYLGKLRLCQFELFSMAV
jgi:hypothetical protein